MTVSPDRNSTIVTVPSLSAAFAVRVTLAGAMNVAPLAGLVRVAVGGAFAVVGWEFGSPGSKIGPGGLACPATQVPLGSPNSAPLEYPSPSESNIAKTEDHWRLVPLGGLSKSAPKLFNGGPSASWQTMQLAGEGGVVPLGIRLR